MAAVDFTAGTSQAVLPRGFISEVVPGGVSRGSCSTLGVYNAVLGLWGYNGGGPVLRVGRRVECRSSLVSVLYAALGA